jgi:hypothetical protein
MLTPKSEYGLKQQTTHIRCNIRVSLDFDDSALGFNERKPRFWIDELLEA